MKTEKIAKPVSFSYGRSQITVPVTDAPLVRQWVAKWNASEVAAARRPLDWYDAHPAERASMIEDEYFDLEAERDQNTRHYQAWRYTGDYSMRDGAMSSVAAEATWIEMYLLGDGEYPKRYEHARQGLLTAGYNL